MIIKEQLEVELSRWNIDLVSEYVGEDRDRFRELWDLLFPENYPVSPRAAWAFESICVKFPHLLKPYLNRLLLALPGIKIRSGYLLSTQALPIRFYPDQPFPAYAWYLPVKYALPVDSMVSPLQSVPFV